jgi:hypothetical protein
MHVVNAFRALGLTLGQLYLFSIAARRRLTQLDALVACPQRLEVESGM